jgi:proteic killer suppression protein
VDKIARILARLNRSRGPQDMAVPGFRLHPLKGKLHEFWSVSVSGNWRIVFRFEGDDAVDVDLVDYH